MSQPASMQTGARDAIVIGGGPAGSTAATLLAREGLRVIVFEKSAFPRFHIGESLLPASVPILQDLGVKEELDRRCLRKPGGKWYYGGRPVFSDFAGGPRGTSFERTPHAYMVKRDEFDELLLENAAKHGAEVRFEHQVTGLLRDGSRVTGVTVRSKDGAVRGVRAPVVFDCSGYGAVVSKQLGIRAENRLRRMAVFGHYRVQALDENVRDGWFVGQMIRNGWVWMIPLKPGFVSVGAVVELERFRMASLTPRAFLEQLMRTVPRVRDGLAGDCELEGDVRVYGNLGYTTQKVYGDGWVLVGDAAFFIDPCYSSGVHLALATARSAAQRYLEMCRTGKTMAACFEPYEKHLRTDERLVLRFVETFYMASRNRFLRWFIPVANTPRLNRAFVAVTGGDFARHPGMINFAYFTSKIAEWLLPFPVREDAPAAKPEPMSDKRVALTELLPEKATERGAGWLRNGGRG